MFLIDENLSWKLVERNSDNFPGVQCVSKTPELGEGTPDEKVWAYAKTCNLAILTKDKDFIDYWKKFGPPPQVRYLNIGNCRLNALEMAIQDNRINIHQCLNSPNDGLLTI